MDDLDRAQHYEERERESALNKVLTRLVEAAEYDPAGYRICVVCGVIIPHLRTEKLNAVRCVECQTALEKRNRNQTNAGRR